MIPEWIEIVNLVANIGIIVVGMKIVRHLTRMEMRVSMMWNEFKRRFEIGENGE